MKQKNTVPGWPAFREFFDATLRARKIVPFHLTKMIDGLPYSTVLTAMDPAAANIKLDTVVKMMTALELTWADVVKAIECKPKPKPRKNAKRTA